MVGSLRAVQAAVGGAVGVTGQPPGGEDVSMCLHARVSAGVQKALGYRVASHQRGRIVRRVGVQTLLSTHCDCQLLSLCQLFHL